MRRIANPQALVAIGLLAVALYAVRHTLGSTTLVLFAVVVPSIILHELSHGVTALAFGDDTARRAGRLTLNPVRHIDPLGTLVLPGGAGPGGAGGLRLRQAGADQPQPHASSPQRRPRRQPGGAGHQPGARRPVRPAAALGRPAGTARAVGFVVANFGVGALAFPTASSTCWAS